VVCNARGENLLATYRLSALTGVIPLQVTATALSCDGEKENPPFAIGYRRD